MRKLTCIALLCMISLYKGQAQTQSIIYDATAIMNARHGVNALVLPTANGCDLFDSYTGKQVGNQTDPQTGQQGFARKSQSDSIFTNSTYSESIIYAILKRNAGMPESTTNADLKNAYSSNPFIAPLLEGSTLEANDPSLRCAQALTTSPKSAGLAQSLLGNLANGTADFLMRRAREEISITVFEKMKTFMARFPEIDTLFPATCTLLQPVNGYEYNKALEALKGSIHEDLQGLISRIPSLYDIPRYQLLNERVPSLSLLFGAGSMFSTLHGKAGFAESVYRMGQQPFLNEKNNYTSLLNVLVIFSNSILDKKLSDDDNKVPEYISKEFIRNVTHGRPTLLAELSQVYLGLLWQHTSSIPFTANGTRTTFAQLLQHWSGKPNISKALETVDITLSAVESADSALATLKTNEDDVAKYTGKSTVMLDQFPIYANLVSQLLSITDLYSDASNGNFAMRVREIRHYVVGFSSGTIEMIKDFDEEQYNFGVSQFADLLKTTSDYLDEMQKDKNQSEVFSTEMTTALAVQKAALETRKDDMAARLDSIPAMGNDPVVNAGIISEQQELKSSIADIDVQLKQVADQQTGNKSAVYKISRLIEYVNILAEISKADNSEAVESILESYALPAGSSRIKKVSSLNFAVNAYVGAFFGRSNTTGTGFTNTYGLSAPIGLTLSTGFQKAGSLSVFASIFDIGGVIKYKLDNEGKYQQDLSLAGIVSPGAHIVYGFPWFLPFSIGAGCQWVSPVTSANNHIDLKPTFNAFIGVDIPMFNLKVIKGK